MDCICSKRVFTGSRNPKPASDILLTQGSGDGYDACIHLLTNQQVTWPEYQLAMVPKTRSGVRPEGVAKKVNTSARKIGTPKLQLHAPQMTPPVKAS